MGHGLLYRTYEAVDACVVLHNRRSLVRLQCTGGQLHFVLMRHPPLLSVKPCGGAVGAGGGGGRWEAGWGVWQLGRGGGDLQATHYYHTHTSRVCVCVSGGMAV